MLQSIADLMGTHTETEVNVDGGKQSILPAAFHLIPAEVIFDTAQVLHYGAEKYGEWNFERIPVEQNLKHALAHIYARLAGDFTDDHLAHALCRVMFAMHVENVESGIVEPRFVPEESDD